MNTDDLITSLGSELTPVRRGTLTKGVAAGLGAGLAVTILMFAAFWGVRPDPGEILGDAPLMGKTFLPLAMGCMAFPWMLAQARPAGRSAVNRIIWIIPMILGILILATLIVVPQQGWPMALQGKSINTCIVSIPVLSLPILIALLAALRRGAPEHPMRCGAVAGLTAAGFGATIYSLYCVESSPLFYGAWYVLAILLVTACGAVGGRILLRW